MNDVVTLFSLWKQLSGYPIQKTDGSNLETIFHAIFSDETVSTLNSGENYTAPVFTTTPEYDYCGNVIGYKTEFVQGSIETSDTTKATQLDSLVSIPPTVKSVTPAVSATGVFTDVTIKVIFSQDMDSESFTTRDNRTSWKPTKTYDAFIDYRVGGMELSSKGKIVIQKMIKGEKCDIESSGLSKREWNELMDSFGFKQHLA